MAETGLKREETGVEQRDQSKNITSKVLIDHAQRPRNNYRLTDYDGRARYTGNCGEMMEIWVRVRDGIVEQAAFTTDGCGVSHACGSMATCMAEGRPLEEIEYIEPEHVIRAFGGLPPDHEHCAELSTTALKLACASVGEPGNGAEVGPEDVAGVVVRVAMPVAGGRLVGMVESAERFALVDVEAAIMRLLAREDVPVPEHLQTSEDAMALPTWLRELGMQVLLCGSLAEDKQAAFVRLGLVAVTDAALDIPEEFIAEYLAGSLQGAS